MSGVSLFIFETSILSSPRRKNAKETSIQRNCSLLLRWQLFFVYPEFVIDIIDDMLQCGGIVLIGYPHRKSPMPAKCPLRYVPYGNRMTASCLSERWRKSGAVIRR
jgi:hypothetical protein